MANIEHQVTSSRKKHASENLEQLTNNLDKMTYEDLKALRLYADMQLKAEGRLDGQGSLKKAKQGHDLLGSVPS